MNETQDPPRWIDGGEEAPEGFDALVRDDEAQGPSTPQLARMLDGLALQLARPELSQAFRAQPPAAVSTAPGAAAAQVGLFGKVGVGLAVIGLAAAGAWLARTPAPPPRRAVVVPAAQPAPGAAPAAAPAQAARQAAPAAVPAQPAPVGRAHVRSAPSLADDPAAELLLLEQAQRALHDDPGGALALAEQHRQRFARGQFEQEREMLAIEALLKLDRAPEARRRAQRFARRHPGSSHLPRLHDLLRSP